MKRVSLFIVLFVFALALAACGGSGGKSSKIDVTMTEFAFSPAEYTVTAGAQVTLNLTNNGTVEHQFAIINKGADIGPEFTEEDAPNVYWETTVPAGQSKTETFTAPSDPGEYQVICGVPGHMPAGMVAKMNVVAP